ncbi:MAG: PKD domain-containing protein, partial [Acidobacteriota bacterium]
NTACAVPDVRACFGASPAAAIEVQGGQLVCVGTEGDTVEFLLDASDTETLGTTIQRFCWTATAGTFVESGLPFHCDSVPTARLRLGEQAGRRQLVATLSVTNDLSCSDSSTVNLVTESDPIILESRGAQSQVCLGESIDFIGRAADTFSGSNRVTLQWDFDIDVDSDDNDVNDDDVDAEVVVVSGQIGVVSHTYDRSGIKTALMTAIGENSDCSVQEMTQVQVITSPIIGSLRRPATTCPGDVEVFSVAAVSGVEPLTFSWDFDIAFDSDGNGIPDDDRQATGMRTEWAYPVPGIFEIGVTVRSAANCEFTRNATVNVVEPPVPGFVSDTPRCNDTIVSFESTATGTPPLLISWDLGDDSPTETGDEFTHVYDEPGTYRITQTIRDGNGCTSTFSEDIVVTDVDLVIQAAILSDGLNGGPGNGNGNGFAEPGENLVLQLEIENTGTADAELVTAGLRVLRPTGSAFLIDADSDLGTIPAGTTRTIQTDLEVLLDPRLPCGNQLELAVDLSAFGSNGCNRTRSFVYNVGQPQLLLPGTRDELASRGAQTAGPVSVTGNASQFLAVFVDQSIAGLQVHLTRLSLIGLPSSAPAQISFSSTTPAGPRIAWADDPMQFGVSWTDSSPTVVSRALFSLMDSTGALIGPPLLLGDDNALDADVAWTDAGWIIGWSEAPRDLPDRTRARLVSHEREALTEGLIFGNAEDHSVQVASTGPTWGAVSLRPIGGAEELTFRLFNSVAPAAWIPLATRILGVSADQLPAIAALGSNYLVSWEDTSGRVQLATFSATGALLRQVDLGPGNDPALAATREVGVISFERDGALRTLPVAANGSAFGTELVIQDFSGNTPTLPAVAAGGSGLFLSGWLSDEDVRVRTISPAAGGPCLVQGLGDLTGDGTLTIADVVLALRAAVGLEPITPELLAIGDLAPGIRAGSQHRPVGNGVIDIGDVVVLLNAAVGLVELTP